MRHVRQGLQGQLQVAKTDQETAMLELQIDAQKLEIDKFKAITERIKVEREAFDPNQVQQLVMQTMQQATQTNMQPASAGFSLPAEQPPAVNPIG